MRKFILIAAMVLVSATAQAGSPRNLTMAANDQPAAAEAPKNTDKATEQPAASAAPKYVERPAAVETATETPKAEPAKTVAEKSVETPKVERPRRKRMSTEARVIYELHRHGIYW